MQMASESTHLHIASIIKGKLPKRQRDLINKSPDIYHFGAIAPDIFMYSLKFRNISKKMHSNETANELIKKTGTDSLPFLYGWLAHIETDIVFHKALPKSAYEHLYSETSVDKCLKLENPIKLNAEIPKQFANISGLPEKMISKLAKRQIIINRLFAKSRFLHYLVPRKAKAMFHRHIRELKTPKNLDRLIKEAIKKSIKRIVCLNKPKTEA